MNISLRRPETEDGVGIYRLAKRCPPLDTNSRYCNLLQASHFQDNSIVAERDGELVGFVTGYRIPKREQVLFVWQVAVSTAVRGRGLGRAMLEALIERNHGIEYLETTVTPSNHASQRMFERLAASYAADINTDLAFDSETHFEGEQEDEVLFRIGPLSPGHQSASHGGVRKSV